MIDTAFSSLTEMAKGLGSVPACAGNGLPVWGFGTLVATRQRRPIASA